jgi:hypothetical protein
MENTPMAATRSSKRVLAAPAEEEAAATAPAKASTKRSKTTAAAAAEAAAAEEEAAATAHAASQAEAAAAAAEFSSEIEPHYDWKVNEKVCGVSGISLYFGIQSQFHCITKNFLYGFTEGSIIFDYTSLPGIDNIVYVIYYRGEFPLRNTEIPHSEYVYRDNTPIFHLLWKAMKNVKRVLDSKITEVQFANIKQGITAGWNICFYSPRTIEIDAPGGTYLQLIPKQPAGGRPKQNQKNKKNKNIKQKTKKLRKRTTKRKSKRTRKSRKH